MWVATLVHGPCAKSSAVVMSLNPRSGWQHISLGRALRNQKELAIQNDETREAAIVATTVTRSTGSLFLATSNLVFRCAPPQALCCQSRRGLGSLQRLHYIVCLSLGLFVQSRVNFVFVMQRFKGVRG